MHKDQENLTINNLTAVNFISMYENPKNWLENFIFEIWLQYLSLLKNDTIV